MRAASAGSIARGSNAPSSASVGVRGITAECGGVGDCSATVLVCGDGRLSAPAACVCAGCGAAAVVSCRGEGGMGRTVCSREGLDSRCPAMRPTAQARA